MIAKIYKLGVLYHAIGLDQYGRIRHQKFATEQRAREYIQSWNHVRHIVVEKV